MYAQQAVEKAIKGALELTRVAIRGHELGVAFTEHVVNAPDHAA
jgi:HEPN domain-containing protein